MSRYELFKSFDSDHCIPSMLLHEQPLPKMVFDRQSDKNDVQLVNVQACGTKSLLYLFYLFTLFALLLLLAYLA